MTDSNLIRLVIAIDYAKRHLAMCASLEFERNWDIKVREAKEELYNYLVPILFRQRNRWGEFLLHPERVVRDTCQIICKEIIDDENLFRSRTS